MKVLDTKQIGEWFEVGMTITDRTAAGKPAIDVTGKAVAVVVRTGRLRTDPAATVDGLTAWTVDAAGGDVAAGGRISTAGTYYGTITVGAASDGPGWPVEEPFAVKYEDAP